MNKRTFDRLPTDETIPATGFFTSEKIGETRELTPEGYLLCKGAALARTGEMLYGPYEVPGEPGPDGLVHVMRGEDDVFRPETLASFQGKPITNDHPVDFVSPENWQRLSVGVVLNPRRGEGEHGSCIIADLLVTDATAIDAIQSGKVELSAGYDAEYEYLGPGRARQYNILANHVALVERGRCGAICSIGDQKTVNTNEVKPMTKRTADRIRKAFKYKDEELLEDALTEIEKGEEKPEAEKDRKKDRAHDEESGHEARIAKLEDCFAKMKDDFEEYKAKDRKAKDEAEKEEKPEADKAKDEEPEAEKEEKPEADKKAKDAVRARDSSHLQSEFSETVAAAEILVPGVALPTFDAATTAAATIERLCSFRRQTLVSAMKDEATGTYVTRVIGGRAFDAATAPCDRVADVFHSAAELKRHATNTENAGTPYVIGSGNGLAVGAVRSVADWNDANKNFWNI
jgi:hypothetical protein